MILEPEQQIKISGRADRDGHFAELTERGERLAVAMGATVEQALENLKRAVERQQPSER